MTQKGVAHLSILFAFGVSSLYAFADEEYHADLNAVDLKECSKVLDDIALDMHWYRTKNEAYHLGDDVWDHSVWTALAVESWFAQNNPWVEKLKNYREIIILTAFLHDIGKSGDEDFKSLLNPGWKISHPEDGMAYILGQKHYRIIDQTVSKDIHSVAHVFDSHFLEAKTHGHFHSISLRDKLLKGCITNVHTLDMLAIGVGMHYEFGNIIVLNVDKHSDVNRAYLDKLKEVIDVSDAEDAFPNTDSELLTLLARFTIAISAADVMGSQAVKFKDNVFPLLRKYRATSVHKPLEVGNFAKFNYDKNLEKRQILLKYIKTSTAGQNDQDKLRQ